MFYEMQDKKQQENYKKMLKYICSLSNLFSEEKTPYLAYRIHENCFCRYFDAENLSRKDVSADAKKGNIGIGLKTWTGNDDQKVAEFNKLKPYYENLSGIDLVKQIAEYRNDRIRFTMNTYGIEKMIYHIVKRVPNKIEIIESPFDYIDVNSIKLIKKKSSRNNTYFTDGKHTYHFSTAKSTLYMNFDTSKVLDHIDINIIEDPYKHLEELFEKEVDNTKLFNFVFESPPQAQETIRNNKLCLRLYETDKNQIKSVCKKSGLNIWNAGGRKRNPNEVYIPYPAVDRKRNPNFFPDSKTKFNLKLPNGKILSAKICQQGGKAIMSNPNSDLGEWLLRDVLDLKVGELVTYKKLELYNVDSVIFTKNDNLNYSIDFSPIGSYEKYYEEQEEMED